LRVEGSVENFQVLVYRLEFSTSSPLVVGSVTRGVCKISARNTLLCSHIILYGCYKIFNSDAKL